MYKISVILPFHRNDDLLKQAIDSCLGSTNVELELLLINTTSMDLRFNDQSVKVFHKPGNNYIEALRFGLTQASHDTIGLMNSDDLIDSSRFYRQVDKLNSEQSDVCLCWIQKTDLKGREIPSLTGKLPFHEFHPSFLLLGPIGADATWVFKKEWATSHSLFADVLDSSDFAVALRVLPKSKVSVVPEYLYLYRTHNSQVTSRRIKPKLTHELGLLTDLNLQLGLPTLTLDQHLAMAFSNLRKGHLGDSKRLREWIEVMMTLNTQNHTYLKNSLISLIRRRILIATWYKLGYWDSKKSLILFVRDLLVLNRNVKR